MDRVLGLTAATVIGVGRAAVLLRLALHREHRHPDESPPGLWEVPA